MSKAESLKPGQTVEKSGQYEIVGPKGGGTGKERTMSRGETAPPTPESGQKFRLVDPTKNKSGR